MKLGTKSLLFGVHQIFIHPIFVTYAWKKLYGTFPSFKELFCIFIHDWGYWGVKDLKGPEGDKHPELGAKIATKLLGKEWGDFILGHSLFYSKRFNIPVSKLFAPDKYWHCICPFWIYKILGTLSGELKYCRNYVGVRQFAPSSASDKVWFKELQKVCLKRIQGKHDIDINKLKEEVEKGGI